MSFSDPMRALRHLLVNIVSRAVVKLVDDDAKMQLLQIEALKGEVRDRAERFQNYGFTSVPLPGAEAVVIFPGGQREHPLVIAVDDRRYRLKALAAGEVALYTDQGDYVHLKRDGNIEIKASTEVVLDVPLVTMTGDLTVNGTVTGETDVIADGISGKNHVHSGVQGGPSNTGAPVP